MIQYACSGGRLFRTSQYLKGKEKNQDGKQIVENVTGRLPAGCTAAVMGPSGGGKTSMLNALCNRAESYANVYGRTWLGSMEDGVRNMPSEIAFVPQDDVMHEDLTVYQNLYYSAMLRLVPGRISR